MIQHPKFAAGVLLGFSLVFSSLSLAAPCAGGGVKPAWIDNPEAITAKYFWASGVSSSNDGPLAERLATAKQNAIKNLAETIQVNVSNSLTLEQTQKQSGAHVLSDSNVRSLTEVSTKASLQNIEAVETWESPDCHVWVRVRLETRIVEQKKREELARQLFAVLTEKLAIAQEAAGEMEARQSAVEAGLDILQRINLDLVPEASSAAYYTQQLTRVKETLGASRSELEKAKKALDEARDHINKAAAQPNATQRARSIMPAVSLYRSLLNQYPNGLNTLFGPGDLYMKLGEAEEMRGSSCGAKNYYLQAIESKQLVDRQKIARQRADGLACSPEDMEKAVWRQFFEGRTVDMLCFYDLRGSQHAWQKACGDVSNTLRSMGAEVVVSNAPLTAAQSTDISNGKLSAKWGREGNLLLGYFAFGKMNTQTSRDGGRQSREYQFQGTIWTLLMENGQATYSDRFQGTTGWNPISSEMVMDVLALNVVKRWKDKFSRFLHHEVEQ